MEFCNFKKEVVSGLKAVLENAIEKSNILPEQKNELKRSFVVEEPNQACHGDFSTNLAMVGAKILKMAPLSVVKQIEPFINLDGTDFERFEVLNPGYVNFFLKNSWFENVLKKICKMGDNFGRSNLKRGKRAIVEFVSANPTGPMHIGNARGGVIGDCVAELLSWVGFDVWREFYLNDAGNQIEKFKRSLSLRYLNLFSNDESFQMPEDLYRGDDIIELAQQFAKIYGNKFVDCSENERQNALVEFALPKNVEALETDLKKYRIIYNEWFRESELHETGKVFEVVEMLKKAGKTFEKEGAVWFAFSKLGGDKDEVLIRENGVPTYFAADIAYHFNKLAIRKFDLAIDVWGADHHGHVARLLGALDALGVDSSALKVVLMQLVRLIRDGVAIKQSKRSGKAITLATLLNEVSVDAARFFFNLREANSHFDFDLDLAVSESSSNPVYYVQYAYARICQILNKLEDVDSIVADEFSLAYEFSDLEKSLAKTLAGFSNEVELAAMELNCSLISKFAIEVATKFHKFYTCFRVADQTGSNLKARVLMCVAVKVVLKNLFSILKISLRDKL